MTLAAVAAIDFYQRFLSPYKGFRCAHRVRHGRSSCSQFAKRLVRKVGLFRFWPILIRRFERCGRAARALKAAAFARRADLNPRAARQKEQQQQKRQERSASDCFDVPDCGGCGDVANAAAPSSCDAPSVPVDGCDCGSGCDISV